MALLAGCQKPASPDPVVGAWRSHVQFSSGPFASLKDLEFMYAVHADGTLTESSNYDAAPPVPPAYGVWRAAGPGQYELHYEFYASAAAKPGADASAGWTPGGRGLLDETVTLAPDGRSFHSTIRLRLVEGVRPAGGGQGQRRRDRGAHRLLTRKSSDWVGPFRRRRRDCEKQSNPNCLSGPIWIRLGSDKLGPDGHKAIAPRVYRSEWDGEQLNWPVVRRKPSGRLGHWENA
jgi:hypothetical protein